ncbi:hypothetical protein PRIPAC_75655 [Pristionchus pacificus]|uniref:Uncharacterized protein n=1 Tax=Pristionchus pacificus TaxID=54126 RepID=A0A2A6C5J0_PRIPA|nr:hypothetical protein PRIPAC_75655 [Pristionchus pacificus]|eukprot:PDM73368.1 hypothetical protein PRIPAC_40724 [Pristionchus pacificus]
MVYGKAPMIKDEGILLDNQVSSKEGTEWGNLNEEIEEDEKEEEKETYKMEISRDAEKLPTSDEATDTSTVLQPTAFSANAPEFHPSTVPRPTTFSVNAPEFHPHYHTSSYRSVTF